MTSIELIFDKNIEMQECKSLPISFDQLTENVFDDYSLYRFNIPSAIIDHYLPDKLRAFSSKTSQNFVKRCFYYSKPVIVTSRLRLNDNVEPLSNSISFGDLFKELLTKNDSTIRYNFVIMDDCLIFIRVPHLRHILYYTLCKHIVLSNQAKEVRYAGELWCDEDNYFQLNNNSGAYRPSDALIGQTVKLFNQLAPELQFHGTTFQKSVQLSIKQRVINKIKQKLTISS